MNTTKHTMKEIAEMAGVSVSMVSLILNGKGRASDKVRTHVIQLLEESGYRPKYARAPFYYIVDLHRIKEAGKTENVLQQLAGIQSVFNEQQLTLYVEFLNSSDSEQQTLQLEAIAKRNPSGVLLNTDAPFLNRACNIFSRKKTPFVQIGYDTENPKYNAVVTDSFTGAYMATKHLLENGHTNVAILQWQGGLAKVNSLKKLAGYQAALAEYKIQINPQYVVPFASTDDQPNWQPTRYLFNQLLELPNPPTALLVDNSFISLSLLYPLADENKLPNSLKKIEMIHFEDWSLRPTHDILTTKLFYTPLETKLVCIDWENIGQTAAKLIIERSREYSIVPQILRISPTIFQVNGSKREPIQSA